MEFNDYYKYYLTLHKNSWNRRLHFAGQLSTLVFILFCLAKSYYLFLVLAPLVVYPFAWSGHFFFEKNEPAAWSNPLWAKYCDLLMCRDMITGKISW
jgi:hypothetical protein